MNKRKIIIIVVILGIVALIYYFMVVKPSTDKPAQARAWLTTWRAGYSDDANWNKTLAALSDQDAINLQYVLSYTGNVFTDNPTMGDWYKSFLQENGLS